MKGPMIFRHIPLELEVYVNNRPCVTVISVYKMWGGTVTLMNFAVFWNMAQAGTLQGRKFLWWGHLGPTKSPWIFALRHGLSSQRLATLPFKFQPINSAERGRRFLLCELSELPKHSVGSECGLNLMQLGVEYLVNTAARGLGTVVVLCPIEVSALK